MALNITVSSSLSGRFGRVVCPKPKHQRKEPLKQIPVDPAVFDQCVVMVVDIEPVVDYDTGAPKTDKHGVRKWKLQLLYKPVGARKPEVVEVGFATNDVPELGPGSRPVFKGLVGRPWQNENEYGYSSGVALSAEQVGFRQAPGTSQERAA